LLAQLLGPVDPRRDRAVGRGDRQRFDLCERRRLGVADKARLRVIRTRFGRGQRFVGGTAGFLKGLEDGGGIGIENDRHIVRASSGSSGSDFPDFFAVFRVVVPRTLVAPGTISWGREPDQW